MAGRDGGRRGVVGARSVMLKCPPVVSLYSVINAQSPLSKVLSPVSLHYNSTIAFFVCAGAGNQTFLGLVDLLDNLFLQGRVVLFKCHELRTGSYPYITALFSDMIRDGFVQVLPPDSTRESVAALLVQVDHVHITGGAASAHRIMWGDTQEEQRAAIAKGQPRVKAMTAELGNVTPYIICPGGSWTDADLRHHASHLAQFVAANASCNCLSPKAVLISSGWEHYTSFMQYLKEELSLQPLWPSYYPGTKQVQKYNDKKK